jgi:transmembrane sensor
MKADQAQELLKKFKAGTAAAEENRLVEEWLQQYRSGEESGLGDEELQAAQARVWNKVLQEQKPARRVRLLPRMAAAASVMFLLGTGGYFYFRQQAEPATQFAKLDIPPGKHTATLTLANGKKIVLADALSGQLAKEAGVTITKTGSGQLVYTVTGKAEAADQMNTLSTARGETYQVILPDGTRVWLNAASSLTYPARFSGMGRNVTLAGEGYFEVAKDKSHPFKVAAAGQDITVLGTHFNVNAYTDEPAAKTTLLEGSVKVAANNRLQLIKPGQQVSFINNQFKVEAIDTGLATAWKNGQTLFDDEDIQTIMRQVSRWYNVEVVYEGKIPNRRFEGGISRRSNLSSLLKVLEANNIHCTLENNRITIKP